MTRPEARDAPLVERNAAATRAALAIGMSGLREIR
jgi:hypothetical protein